jgi:hypothetical protein
MSLTRLITTRNIYLRFIFLRFDAFVLYILVSVHFGDLSYLHRDILGSFHSEMLVSVQLHLTFWCPCSLTFGVLFVLAENMYRYGTVIDISIAVYVSWHPDISMSL